MSPNVAIETLRNWYPQSVEVPTEPARVVYIPRPGLRTICALPTSPIRVIFQQDGRMFAVGGQVLYELFPYLDNAGATSRGMLSAVDANPVTVNSNGVAGHQLYITSAGKGHIYDLDTNTLTAITALGYPARAGIGTYLDTYFLTTKLDSAQFNISGILDGLSWSALDFDVRVQASDNIVGIIQFNKVIWLIGSQTSEPWYDSGAATFPFQSVPQVLIPVGCCAAYSIMRTSQALCWLHQSERGRGIFMAAPDYTPRRVSTFALESIWATYPTIADTVAFGLTWQGHEFAVVSFPSGNATWAYDMTESENVGQPIWSNWSWWNTVTGAHDRFRGWVHCQGFGANYVGDWETGVIYQLDATLSVDADAPIVWERTAPHLNNEQRFIFYGNAQLDMETGLGGSRPHALLDWSDDGGHTFSTPITMNTGALGQYLTRCRVAGTLGRSRDRAFRVRMSNDVPPRLLQFYVDAQKGTA